MKHKIHFVTWRFSGLPIYKDVNNQDNTLLKLIPGGGAEFIDAAVKMDGPVLQEGALFSRFHKPNGAGRLWSGTTIAR